ncbi:MAG TPA: protease modulator HflC [Methylomirabilota bacterium]|nr:protease modulator HflC [Methylomirabilota bacterium]
MKRNSISIIVGILLLIIFFLLLFTFQVRQTQVAVISTFDKPTRFITNSPGLHFKWPRPIQKVVKFDKRVQNFEDKFEETMTKDNFPLLMSLYVGWTIANPQQFMDRFPAARPEVAQSAMQGLVRSAKNAVIGQHPFSHFVSFNQQDLKFDDIQAEMHKLIAPQALQNYGIEVRFVGIKRLGLPESVTQKVFDRMSAERQREVERLRAQGDAEARKIRSAADRERNELVVRAEAQATELRSQADAEASKALAVFAEAPELAEFLLKLRALETSMKDRTTLILDDRMPPFDLLTTLQTNRPASNAQPSQAQRAPAVSSNP